MSWQAALADDLARRIGPDTELSVVGSATDPDLLDGWSDLDVRVATTAPAPLPLLDGFAVWAYEQHRATDGQTLRVVLADGRRIDLGTTGGTIAVPEPTDDHHVRFVAALAAAKLGRGDRLIGLHLAFELAREALVQAMLLRDRDLGTDVHRVGSSRDALADDLMARLDPGDRTAGPGLTVAMVEAYGSWRGELDPAYRPDWSGLHAVIDRGRAGRPELG